MPAQCLLKSGVNQEHLVRIAQRGNLEGLLNLVLPSDPRRLFVENVTLQKLAVIGIGVSRKSHPGVYDAWTFRVFALVPCCGMPK